MKKRGPPQRIAAAAGGKAAGPPDPAGVGRTDVDEWIQRGPRELAILVQELQAEIAGRIRTEEALRSEQAYRESIEDCLHTGIVAFDARGTHRHVNNAFCEMTGFSRHELVGAGLPYPYWASDRRKSYAALIRKIFKSGAIPPDGFEQQFVRRDGRRLEVLWHISPLAIGVSERGYVASVHDITNRVRTETALRESEERFRSLLAGLPVGICIMRDRKVVFANAEQVTLLCPPAGDAPFGGSVNIHPDDAAAFDALYGSAAISGSAPETDVRVLARGAVDANEETRWVRCRAVSVRYHGTDAVLMTMMDVTRAKELEQLLSVREKLASLGQLSAGIAHEIRNPLSGINIYLSTLELFFTRAAETGSLDSAPLHETITQIRGASSKIASVIQRVMDFAKPTPPRLGAVDANRIVEEAVRAAAAALRRHGIAFSLALAPDLPACHADPHLIEQVLTNLINNAVQAMESWKGPKRLEIASAAENGRVVIRVSDSGPGVPVSMRRRVFDPFYTTRKEGYGIGLSFSHQVITEHGGSLAVGTSRWGGAEFRIALATEGSEAAG